MNLLNYYKDKAAQEVAYYGEFGDLHVGLMWGTCLGDFRKGDSCSVCRQEESAHPVKLEGA